ncbi:MAG: 23S rRNA (guanosine(2251)-2'-O)-methyltransferase RlmB [Microscillaceae bacterium]|jgi:23S rRNA (guanosine2251-2'-O)-methyltransferase|nr:23S rRNA (guanosine(2251)-2'-O)-methyltransferase RlmB [Microscillaceae bacterium]
MQSNQDKEKDWVFGIQPVLEALRAEKEIEKVLLQNDIDKSSKIQEIVEILRAREIPYQKVPIEKLHRLTRKNHQGVIAFVTPIRYVKLSNIVQGIFEQGKNPLLLILDRITDVRNFGAICRTAEVAGVDAIVVPLKGSAQIGSDAMRTSSGALNFIPICRENNLNATLKYLEDSGLQIVACTEKAQDYLYEADFTLPTALLMGSEEDGISADLLRKATQKVKIPVLGQVTSLNVSVATGIAVFEVVRQRL